MQSAALCMYNLLSVLERVGRFVSHDAPTVLSPIPTVLKKYPSLILLGAGNALTNSLG